MAKNINLEEEEKKLELANKRKRDIEEVIDKSKYSKTDIAIMADCSRVIFSHWLSGTMQHEGLDNLIQKIAGKDFLNLYKNLHKKYKNC